MPLNFYMRLVFPCILAVVFDKHGSSRTYKTPKIEITLRL